MLSTIKRGCDLGRLIIVFGAGETAESVIKILQKEDIKISHICDNDIKKQGKFFHGYNVLSASEIQHFNNPIVIVASLYFKEIEKQLKELGVSSIIIYKELYLKKNTFYEKISFPRCSSPEVSIVLTVYNEWQYTYECLKSIVHAKTNIQYEVIVGDNVSTDETRNIEQYVQNITIIHNKENLGYLRNCNETAKHAKGKYIVLLSNDVKIVTDYWIDKWLESFIKDNSIGALGGVVYAWNLEDCNFGYSVNDKIEFVANEKKNGIYDVDYLCPACICYRTNVWTEIGGYDELFYPAWYEDIDAYCKLRKHGYRLVLDTNIRYIHYENVTYGITREQNSIFCQNRQKFIDKWSADREFVTTI
jgi:Predicted glycosyltransferases